MPDPPDTHNIRLGKYKRRAHMVIWVGAGLGGLVALCTGDAFDRAPTWLKAVEVTSVILSGSFLALARVKFEWAATSIERSIEGDENVKNAPFQEEWPQDAEECWSASLSCLLLAGVTMVACFWWPVFSLANGQPGKADSFSSRDRPTVRHTEDRLLENSEYLRMQVERLPIMHWISK